MVNLAKPQQVSLFAATIAIVSMIVAIALILMRPLNDSRFENASVLDLCNVDVESLKWDDLTATIQLSQNSESVLNDILAKSQGQDHQATIYLQGMLLLSRGTPSLALSAFDKLDIAQVPAQWLYGPFRLHDELRPEVDNRYLDPLLKAIDAKKVSSLVEARVKVRQGQLRHGLRAYLRTNPATWNAVDLRCMERLAHHAGLRSEVQRTILAALSAGQLPGRYARELSSIASGGSDSSATKIRDHVKQAIRNDRRIADLATDSAGGIQKNRQMFLEGDFQLLLNEQWGIDPLNMTTETVLMLFLSSLRTGEQAMATTMGQELKRREPDLESIRWIDRLIKETFSGP